MLAERLGKWPWEVEEMVPSSMMREFHALVKQEQKEARGR